MEKNSSQFLSSAPVRGSEVVHNNDATYITLHSCNAIVMDMQSISFQWANSVTLFGTLDISLVTFIDSRRLNITP